MLNEKQQEFINKFKNLQTNIIGLYGAAGTGKTYTVRQLSELGYRVAYTAPTNKAVRVLIDSGCNPLNCMTIYRFFGLAVKESDGSTTIDKATISQVSYYDVLVVDESSMINTEICGYIEIAARNMKIVIMGDNAQLPPVNETVSRAFKLVGDNYIELTEQMRQNDAANPLLSLLHDVRQSVFNGQRWELSAFSTYAKQLNGNGVVVTNNKHQFEHWLKSSFARGDSNIIGIAYRNARVNELNSIVHHHLHNDDALQIGQSIVFNSVYKESYNNGQIIEVETIKPAVKRFHVGSELYYIDCYRVNDDIYIPTHKADYQRFLDMIISEIKHNPQSTTSWYQYYTVRNSLADVSHCYAITAHKSQGSTYNNVFIDLRDLLTAPMNVNEMNRCLYTALSRAKFNVVLLI